MTLFADCLTSSETKSPRPRAAANRLVEREANAAARLAEVGQE